VERRDIVYMMRVNNRTPTFIGDLRSQIGAAQLGVRRLKDVVRRYGPAAVRAAVDHSIAYAARRFRDEVRAWPDGEYEADAYVDHDPVGNLDIHVHVKVTVRGDALTVDFTGSDTRQDLKAYSSFGNTRGYVVAQLATMMDPTIPKNEGFFESIDLVVPRGCVLNPDEGKTVAAGTHHPGVEVGEAIAIAMSRVLPERSSPQVYKMGMPTVVVGVHPETGQRFIDHGVDTLAAYCSAVKGQDGWGSMPASFGNLIRGTAEMKESLFPVRHEHCDYRTDSGGAGQWRGCPGSRIVKRLSVPATVNAYMVGIKYPMPGLQGGKPGAPNHLTVRYGTPSETVIDRLANAVPHEAGEAFEYLYGGGGGWGDPLDRDPAHVLDDVLDEYVSVEAARREYGVVLVHSPDAPNGGDSFDNDDLRVDEEATNSLRAELRRRGGRG
jgi:N-methylhydantoinase B